MGRVVQFNKGGNKMITIYDVANYFIKKSNNDDESPMTPLKLQKLCYYAQAWSLAWDEKELFEDQFQAWIHGPANYDLFRKYKDNNMNETINAIDNDYNEQNFNKDQIETLEIVWDEYGKYTGYYLEQLTHQERPWIETRGDLEPGAPSKKVICVKLMKDYYSTLNG